MALSLEQFRDRILHFRSVWRSLEPQTLFGGLALADFEAQTSESLEVSERIEALEAELAALRTRRNQVDKQSAQVMERLVFSVRATPGHGDDCGFYRALGYIPASERKTGLTRKTKHPALST